jgi:hypothetical protein
MKLIYYDPRTWEWVPSPHDYRVRVYDRNSWLVERTGSGGADVVDLEGEAKCTCSDFLYRKGLEGREEARPTRKYEYPTCKHIRLVKLFLRVSEAVV